MDAHAKRTMVRDMVDRGEIRYIGKSPKHLDTLHVTNDAAIRLSTIGIETTAAPRWLQDEAPPMNPEYGATISISCSTHKGGCLLGLFGDYEGVNDALKHIRHVPPMESAQFQIKNRIHAGMVIGAKERPELLGSKR